MTKDLIQVSGYSFFLNLNHTVHLGLCLKLFNLSLLACSVSLIPSNHDSSISISGLCPQILLWQNDNNNNNDIDLNKSTSKMATTLDL